MAGKIAHNLIGFRFGSLSVVSRSEDRGNGIKPVVKWNCICDCGAQRIVSSHALLTGHTKSCGCKKIKHGLSHKERLYETWKNMRRRCNDPKNKRWLQYGGKGIKICPEWDEYLAFRAWAMANGYDDTLTIDRIDVNGNYCPDNCRWADAKTQANNNSRNKLFNYEGKTLTMSQLSEELGITYSALQHRVERRQSLSGASEIK